MGLRNIRTFRCGGTLNFMLSIMGLKFEPYKRTSMHKHFNDYTFLLFSFESKNFIKKGFGGIFLVKIHISKIPDLNNIIQNLFKAFL